MLDRWQNVLRAKRFMRSSSNKVVSSTILDSKGALITKYDLIPILTCPVQMLFCPNKPGPSLLFRNFWFLLRFASLKPLPSNLFRIVDIGSSTPVLWRHCLRSSVLVRRQSDQSPVLSNGWFHLFSSSRTFFKFSGFLQSLYSNIYTSFGATHLWCNLSFWYSLLMLVNNQMPLLITKTLRHLDF